MSTHLGKPFKSNRFKRIKIDKTNHINERKSLGFGEDKFNFDDALKSTDVPYLEFTNFFADNNDMMFKFAKKEYKKLLYGNVDLDSEYEMKFVNVEDGFNELKIKKIYSDTLGKTIRDLPIIYKLKNKFSKELQFYVTSNSGAFKVCFIDIYHLAIPTKEQDTKEIYEKNNWKKYCMSHLKD